MVFNSVDNSLNSGWPTIINLETESYCIRIIKTDPNINILVVWPLTL